MGAIAEQLYGATCDELARLGASVRRGVFGADTSVASVNGGPVALLLEP